MDRPQREDCRSNCKDGRADGHRLIVPCTTSKAKVKKRRTTRGIAVAGPPTAERGVAARSDGGPATRRTIQTGARDTKRSGRSPRSVVTARTRLNRPEGL